MISRPAAWSAPRWPAVAPWVLVIAVVNSLVPSALSLLDHVGWAGAIAQTFGVSMIVVAAAAAGTMLAARIPPRAVDARDWAVLAATGALMLIPVGAASLGALLLLALHIGWRDRSAPDAVAAATLFGGLAIMQLLIGPFLQLLAARLMALDALAVATLLGLVQPGVTHAGNLVDVPAGQSLIIDAECASVVPLLQTVLCWLTIVRLFRPAWRRADLKALPFIVLPVVAANLLRMSAMGYSPESYTVVHGPVGVYAITILCILVAVGAARWTLAHAPAAVAGR